MAKQRRDISNSHFKPLYATFLVLAVCFVMILSIDFGSALEFDNKKSYDEGTKTATIKDCDFWLGTCLIEGDDLATVVLTSPMNVKVGAGEDVLVGEFNITTAGDFMDVFGELYLTNMKNGNEIVRGKQYKYKKYTEKKVDTFGTFCESQTSINGTIEQVCEEVENGTKLATQMDWKPILNPNEVFYAGITYEIGVFVDVELNDCGDWKPEILGVEIPEWATWEADLFIGMVSYYQLNETSGAVVDIHGTNNGTNNGATRGVTGKIENAFDFDGSNDYVSMDNHIGYSDFTVTGWFNADNIISDGTIFENRYSVSGNPLVSIYVGSNNLNFRLRSNAGTGIKSITKPISTETWYFFTAKFTQSIGLMSLAMNAGTPITDTYSGGTFSDIDQGAVGVNAFNYGTEFFNGRIDEVGMWNKTLTTTEIDFLYNDGNGRAYVGEVVSHPSITLNSPPSTNYTTLQDLTINFTASDEINLENVSLYVNDVLNQTNTSGINNTDYLFNLSLGDGIYEIYGTATDNESQSANSSTITIIINTTPNIQFQSPTQIDNYNSSSSVIPINVTLTETYFQNITFNINGTKYTYTDGTRFINNSYPDGSYNYNVTTCTTTGKCNVTETITINIDAGKILTLSYPGNDTIISNDTITFITILNSSDTSEEWINITYYLWNSDGLVNNETNIISGFNLTDNTTFANLTLRGYHWSALAWYGNPAHKDYIWATDGNFTFSIGATVDNESYNNETYETVANIFNINTTLFEGVVVHAAYLYYDDVKYVGEVTGLGSNQYSMTKSLDIPLINGVAENRSFYWSFIYTSPVQKTQNTTIKNQTVSPIFFGLCDANYTVHALDISIKEEGTFDDLNGTLEFASEYWLGSGSVTKEFVYSYLENDTSSYDFCISPTYETFNIDDIISYTATDYDRRDYFLNNAELSNDTMNLSLYLLPTATTDIFTITVQDQDSKPVEGVFVNVQRWDIGTNNFYTIGMIKTTSDGTGIINSRLNDAWYRYQVTYNDILYLTTEPVKEAGTSRTLKINLETDNPYDRFNDIDYSLTYDENTNISVFTFSDTTGAVAIGCLKVLRMEGNGTTEVYYSCVESSSGTLSHKIEDDGTYVIRAIFRLSAAYDNIEQVVDEIIRQGTSFRFITIGKFGQFISLMVVGTASMIGVATGSIPLGLGLIAVSLIIVNLLGWLNITSSVLYGIISIIILIGINLRRGR